MRDAKEAIFNFLISNVKAEQKIFSCVKLKIRICECTNGLAAQWAKLRKKLQFSNLPQRQKSMFFEIFSNEEVIERA